MMYPSESCLEVSNLSCERGFRSLFNNLCFTLKAGEAAHIAGLNGAGKTTLLRAIAGLLQPESGEITLNGDPIPEQQAGVAWLGHKIALKDNLTARENLEFAEAIQGITSCNTIDYCIKLLNMIDYCDAPVARLSAGQKQRIALARIIRTDAQLWLLDEPATALDGDGARILQRLIEQHTEKNGIVLYTGHQPLHLPASCLTTIHI